MNAALFYSEYIGFYVQKAIVPVTVRHFAFVWKYSESKRR